VLKKQPSLQVHPRHRCRRRTTTLTRVLGTRGLILASPSVMTRVLPGCGFDSSGQALLVEAFRGELLRNGAGPRLGSGRLSARRRDDRHGRRQDHRHGRRSSPDRARIPVIIVPTIASSDAPCSGCAVVYSEGGVFECVTYQRTNPAAVLVDLDIIAAAPARLLVAGMGDALSTLVRSEVMLLHSTQSMNECGGYSTRLGLSARQTLL